MSGLKRLTKVDGIGMNELIRCFGCGPEKVGEGLENCGYCEDGWQKALDRLSAYEDTGLLPEAVRELLADATVMREQLKVYKQAEAEGRLTIQPRIYGSRCGSCRNFCCEAGKKKGLCSLRVWKLDKEGQPTGVPFEPYRSRRACGSYAPREDGAPMGEAAEGGSWLEKRFCEVV